MQLVILHYHLNRGGVTTVIENHLRSLATLAPSAQPSRATIVFGGRDAAWNHQLADELPFDCQLVALPALEYDNFRENNESLDDALQKLLEPFDRQSTIVHIHNHSLGKNAEIAPTICNLANDSWRLLLQIHDFAEDLRPANYQHLVQHAESIEQLQENLYPQAKQIHYAVLNQRDRQILESAAVARDHLHLIPNPVKIRDSQPIDDVIAAARAKLNESLELPNDHQLALYPVRPIRRKNIGELLLWSVLADNVTFALTLAPLNPQEQAIYQQWVQFAEENRLPVRFEIANSTELHFEQVYAAADFIITTSVAEGFGMAYLEASLAHQSLLGRYLPSVCQDFEAAGMAFPGLAAAMPIPTTEVNIPQVKQCYQQHTAELRKAYGLPPAIPTDFESLDSLFSADAIDFGRLESSEQRRLLHKLLTDASLRETVRRLNPNVSMQNALDANEQQRTFENNCRVIAERFSPRVIGEQLSGIYQSMLASKLTTVVRSSVTAKAVLGSFVHPSQLFPIRLES